MAPLRLGFGSSILVLQSGLFDFLGLELAPFDTFADFARLGDVVGLSVLVVGICLLVVQLVGRRVHQDRLFAERRMFGEGWFAVARSATLESGQIVVWPRGAEEVGLALLLRKVIQ